MLSQITWQLQPILAVYFFSLLLAPLLTKGFLLRSKLTFSKNFELVPYRSFSKNGIKMAFDTFVQVQSRSQVKCSLKSDTGVSLNDYMRLPVDQYVLIEMPLNSKLERIGDAEFKLKVPPVNFFWMEVIPTVYCTVTSSEDSVQIESCKCVLSGSNIVEGLNDSFKFYVCTKFKWVDSPTRKIIFSNSKINVEIDPPGPFKAIPKSALEATGNAVMQIALKTVERSFIISLSEDYNRWAVDLKYRKERANLGELAAIQS